MFEHCEAVGRDRAEITLSGHMWLTPGKDLAEFAAEAAAFEAVGMDLAIVYLTPPLDASVLTPLAEALSPLR